MIIDFVKIKIKLYEIEQKIIATEMKRRMPFVSSIGVRQIHEGKKQTTQTADKEKTELSFREAASEFKLSRDEMKSIKIPEAVKKFAELADDLAGKTEKGVFEMLTKKVEEKKRNVPGNPPLSADALLQALDMMYIDFEDDDRQKPVHPTLVIHPDQLPQLKQQEAEMTEDDKARFKAKEEEIFDRKYAEYMEREGKRKIID